jgi:hypothetical protein
LVTRLQHMVLDDIDEPSSLVAPLSMVVELPRGRINTMTANVVYWGTQSALVPTLSHFLKLNSDLEPLGSGCYVDLTNDQADAL